jgi:hypothetical protein
MWRSILSRYSATVRCESFSLSPSRFRRGSARALPANGAQDGRRDMGDDLKATGAGKCCGVKWSATSRGGKVLTNVELERALEFPWEKWTVFLHPDQRALVERTFGNRSPISF